ncbi:hypothetical protein CDD83_2130 [Cordyceps sp. RAO-2017]|nr:hypothetical protein CDD83_2130 [Cordyceps sp. RAO-2017]
MHRTVALALLSASSALAQSRSQPAPPAQQNGPSRNLEPPPPPQGAPSQDLGTSPAASSCESAGQADGQAGGSTCSEKALEFNIPDLRPESVCGHEATNRLYASYLYDGALSEIDPTNGTEIQKIKTPQEHKVSDNPDYHASGCDVLPDGRVCVSINDGEVFNSQGDESKAKVDDFIYCYDPKKGGKEVVDRINLTELDKDCPHSHQDITHTDKFAFAACTYPGSIVSFTHGLKDGKVVYSAKGRDGSTKEADGSSPVKEKDGSTKEADGSSPVKEKDRSTNEVDGTKPTENAGGLRSRAEAGSPNAGTLTKPGITAVKVGPDGRLIATDQSSRHGSFLISFETKQDGSLGEPQPIRIKDKNGQEVKTIGDNMDGLLIPPLFKGEIILTADGQNGTDVFECCSKDAWKECTHQKNIPNPELNNKGFTTGHFQFNDHIYTVIEFFVDDPKAGPKKEKFPTQDITCKIEKPTCDNEGAVRVKTGPVRNKPPVLESVGAKLALESVGAKLVLESVGAKLVLESVGAKLALESVRIEHKK